MPGNIKQGTLTFSGFLGMAPAGSSRTNLQFGESYHVASTSSVDTIATIGVLAPGKAPGTNIDGSSNLSAPINRFIWTSGLAPYSAVFAIERGTKLHLGVADGSQWNTGGVVPSGWPTTLTVTGSHTGHTSIVGDDVLYYASNAYVTYTDSNDGDVAKVDLSGSATTNWFSTRTGGAVLSASRPHPIVLGENGFGYVADGNAIHKIDFSGSGTVTTSAIDLGAEWTIYDMIPYQGNLWIIALRTDQNFIPYDSTLAESIYAIRQAGVFRWNYQSRKSSEFAGFERGTPYILDSVSRVSNIFIYDGVPHTITLGSNFSTQLRRFTGTGFQVIHEEPGDIMPIKGGIGTYFRNILWAAKATGDLYTYGRMSLNMPEVFNKIGSTGAASRALFLSDTGDIWASYGTSSLKKMDGMALAASATTLTKQLPKFSRITRITVFFQPQSDTTANNTLTISTYKNFSTSAISKTLVATHAGDLARGWVTFNNLGGEDWAGFHAASFKLDWANTAGVTTSFKPYRIEVEYQVEGQDV